MNDLAALLELSAARHRHLCPRQVLGVRMGLLAGEYLQLSLPQQHKRLFTIVETDGCFADGIAVATGCEMGHRTLRLLDYGKVAATFVDTTSGNACRIVPHSNSRSLAQLETAATRGSRWQQYLEAYQTLPAAALFVVKAVQLNFSLDQLLSHPRFRTTCSHCHEEIINQREVVQNGQILCQACAYGGYYDEVAAEVLVVPEK